MYINWEEAWPWIAVFWPACLIASVVWLVLQVVAWWRIFAKAGEPGWKSLIPIYSTYIQFKIAWDPQYFWITVALNAGMAVAPLLGMVILWVSAPVIGGILCALLALCMFAAGVAAFLINILLVHHLSLVFGHGVGFTLGLLFLQPIFILILGLGGSQYWGGNASNF